MLFSCAECGVRSADNFSVAFFKFVLPICICIEKNFGNRVSDGTVKHLEFRSSQVRALHFLDLFDLPIWRQSIRPRQILLVSGKCFLFVFVAQLRHR